MHTRNRSRTTLAFHLMLLIGLPSVVDAQESIRIEAPPGQELIVLLDETADPGVFAPEAIVDQIAGQRRDLTDLGRRLQFPDTARHLIEDQRLGPDDRARRAPDDVEVRLHRYVVLGYGDAARAEQARAVLETDPVVLSVGTNQSMTYSITPGDPTYAKKIPVASKTLEFQWAYHDFPDPGGALSMNLQQAWDKVRGTAYIGHIDFGIQIDHKDLGGAYRPQFAYNVVANNAEVDEGYSNATQYRGHGTHTAGIIAANTNYPGIKPGYPAYPAVGVSGTCWWCSLMVVKTGHMPFSYSLANGAASIYWAARRGAQVINISSGVKRTHLTAALIQCGVSDYDAYCDSLDFAENADTTIVAAVGNHKTKRIQFPSNESSTIAVGATQYDPATTRVWQESAGETNSDPEMQSHGVAAPGRDIISTVYHGYDWNETIRCGDGPFAGPADKGYGGCTGTSMAAPFVTGIVAMMRSVNPLLRSADIRKKLFDTASPIATLGLYVGRGIVDANKAVVSTLATTNRLTPLFSMKSNHQTDHFYTVVPQQARAAYMGALLPQVSPPPQLPGFPTYDFIGAAVKPNRTQHTIGTGLGGSLATKAEVWVFSTHVNPKNPAIELLPLYRLSYKCGDPVPSGRATVCGALPKHVDHFYTTDIQELLVFTPGHGYKPDGIEGYVYPPTIPQPAGTTPLLRAYHAGNDDYAIFPQSKQAAMAAQGFTGNLKTLGFVYLNPATGARPSL